MRLFKPLSAQAIGVVAALVTVVIWTSFIVIARATADPSRGGALNPLDIMFARLLGAGLVLLPVGWWMVRRDRARGHQGASMFGFSPLPLKVTVTVGFFGGLLYGVLAYSGFVFAPAGHAAVERLAAEIRLRSGDAAGALALAEAGAARFVGARALIHLQAEALLALQEPTRAARFLQDQIALYRADARLWQLLARAHNALNETALAHRATAEEYAISGRWLAAVEQLRLALRLGTLDFYTGSLVDARMKEFQAEYQREQKEKIR